MAQSLPLVERHEAPIPPIAADRTSFEPVFVGMPPGNLHVPSGTTTTQAWLDHLGHAIARRPDDLTAHVRRVLLANTTRDVDATYCALLDLFLALGGRGEALRIDLLRRCADTLGAQRHGRLCELPNAIPSSADVAMAGGCRLASTRSTEIVVRRASAPEHSGSTAIGHAAAMEDIENGQIESAQQALEEALQLDPDDIPASELLLDIYRRSHDAIGFRRMHSRMRAARGPARALWLGAEPFFDALPG